MKTVYLLKNCPKSFGVLLKLVKMGEITTNIVIVDKFYCKILKKDKRVKEFPFIINTFPTATGLIPKIATVIPFKIYLENKKYIQNKKYIKNNYRCNYNRGRTITYKPMNTKKSPQAKNFKQAKNFTQAKNFKQAKKSTQAIKIKKQTIKAIKQKDESVNIILYNY